MDDVKEKLNNGLVSFLSFCSIFSFISKFLLCFSSTKFSLSFSFKFFSLFSLSSIFFLFSSKFFSFESVEVKIEGKEILGFVLSEERFLWALTNFLLERIDSSPRFQVSSSISFILSLSSSFLNCSFAILFLFFSSLFFSFSYSFIFHSNL